MTKPVIFTGIRANNDLHLGNYMGALLPMVDMARQRADDYIVDLMVADLHSFTTPIDHAKLQSQIMDNLRVYAAAGLPLDHDNIRPFRQSYIPAHAELAWILDCFTGFGEMGRMVEFKDKSAKLGDDRVNVGLFNYPVLMAADMLLYDSLYVPVGEEQTQHLEYTRDIGERMNAKFGELFVVPKPVKEQHEFFGRDQGLRIKDLLDPTKKMSKSDESGKGVIFLSDSPEVARKKIMGAATDSLGDVRFDFEKRPGVSNLMQILALLEGRALPEVIKAYEGQPQYGPLKQAVADEVAKFLEAFQTRLVAVDEQKLQAKLESSEAAMNEVANKTLQRVQRAVGLRPKRGETEKTRAGAVAKPSVIDFADFAKLDIRIGTIITAKAVDGSDKLIELTIDLGLEKRTVVTGMREFYQPEDFVDKQLPIIANLKPQTFRGAKSHGMLMAVEGQNGPVLLLPEQPVPVGSPIE